MSTRISRVVPATTRTLGLGLSVSSVDCGALGVAASPIMLLDHFRISTSPFQPHPHAGFAAVTYVLPDSDGGLRSRTSLGDDLVIGPGGIVWTQAGSGLIHEEAPSEAGRELHGVQIFVNASSSRKLTAPHVLHLERDEAPEWRSADGDHVRAIVGSFEGLSSPLVPVEPFRLLDVELRRGFSFDVAAGDNALVYVLHGEILVRAEGDERRLAEEQAVTLRGDDTPAALEALRPARLLILSGAEIHEQVVEQGPFIMNEQSQIDAAFARYRAGEMGRLTPMAKIRAPSNEASIERA
ncbi:pirin family protein [Methylosinus sporium]|uniref:pirin family protein n=1 Tax=Methylosinus sporium TaxID=428 RepID=UPI00383AABE6